MSSHLDTALLTLDQAAYKWCPEGRTRGASNDEGEGPHTTVNRSSWGSANVHTRCLGDDCMFWRWHDRTERSQNHLAVVRAEWDQVGPAACGAWLGKPDDEQPWELDSEQGVWFIPAPTLPPRGYCGKAGHPYAAHLIEEQLQLLQHQNFDHRYGR